MELKKLPILYSRSTTGKISTWEIEYTEDSYRTISGFYGMKLVTSEWTKCDGKSYNTTAEQTEKEAKALWKKKVESGMFEDINKVDEETFFEPMLCKDFKKEKGKIDYREKVFVQRKYDGIRCIIKKDGMWTRSGKQILSAPHISNDLKDLFKQDPNLILDGELFAEKEICDFNTIISLVRKTKPNEEDIIESSKYIKYYIYDLPSCNMNYFDRYTNLGNLNLPECCVLVETYQVINENEIKNFYTQFIEENYEGLIVRLNGPYENKRSKYILKFKEFFDQEFIIKDIIQGIGKLTNKAGTVLCETKEGNIFNSSINGTHDFLKECWDNRENLIGKQCTVKFFEWTVKNEDGTGGVPRFPKVTQIDRSWELKEEP